MQQVSVPSVRLDERKDAAVCKVSLSHLLSKLTLHDSGDINPEISFRDLP